MKVQIFEQYQGGHYTNYIQNLLPTLIHWKQKGFLQDIVVTITREHLESSIFQKKLSQFSDDVEFEACLEFVDSTARLSMDPIAIIKNPNAAREPMKWRRFISNNLVSSINRVNPDYLISTTADSQNSIPRDLRQKLPKKLQSTGICHYGYTGATDTFKDNLKDFGYRFQWMNAPWSRTYTVNPLIYESIQQSKFFPKGKLSLMPHPVPPANYLEKKDARRKMNLPVEGRYIGFVGEMDHRKAIPELLQAFSDAPTRSTDKLLLAGKLSSHFRSIIDDKFQHLIEQDRLILIDRFLDDDEMEAATCALDAVAILYYRHPNLSANLLQAFALKRPIITNAFGYSGMMINKFDFGWACNPLDPFELIQTLMQALENYDNKCFSRRLDRLREFHTAENYASTALIDLQQKFPSEICQPKSWEWVLGEQEINTVQNQYFLKR
jgi:glycosyltransferase involved in cell wall biosynthesis